MKFQLNEKGIQAVMNQSHLAMKRTAFKMETLLRSDIPVDTGTTATGIHTVEISPGRFLVGSNEWSAHVMEYGRKPGKFPNLDALVGWTARKIGSTSRTSDYDALKGSKEGNKLRQVVYLVARSIAKNGIKAKKIFSKSWEKHQASIEQYFYNEMRKNG